MTLPPIGGIGASWSPKNYDGGGSGATTIRRGLEFSKNLVTARLLEGGIAKSAPQSLQRVCDIALEAQIYAECERYYRSSSRAQPVRMIDLASFYAAIANEGARPSPTPSNRSSATASGLCPARQGARADRLGGSRRVLPAQDHAPGRDPARHRAAALGRLGLCGGQDRHLGERERRVVRGLLQRDHGRGLGRLRQRRRRAQDARPRPDRWPRRGADRAGDLPGRLGQRRAAHAARAPSPEAKAYIADLPIEPRSGQRVAGGGFIEHFRLKDGRVPDTQYALVPRETMYAMRPDSEDGDGVGAEDGADVAGDILGNLMGGGRRDGYDPFGRDRPDADPRYADPRSFPPILGPPRRP